MGPGHGTESAELFSNEERVGKSRRHTEADYREGSAMERNLPKV